MIKKPADRASKTKIYTTQNFQFTFIIELWTKMPLSKHKSHNYATVKMAHWLNSVPTKLSAQVQILPVAIFTFF